ncbi:GNAT family N-acetyltransferase [Arenibacter palladensis]|uniref:GNAT family N-acetyltransferase n=1 Tax=Arenibacter palladensis TaxID=237373 RepID=UPI002FCFA6FD
MGRNIFYFKFYEQHIIPNCIANLSFAHNKKVFYQKTGSNASLSNANHLGLFPTYINFEVIHPEKFKRVQIKDNKIDGCAIALEGYDSIDNYIKSQFRSKNKTGLNRSIKRLEKSFRLRHRIFFGEITREDYIFLMTTLKAMLSSRFSLINKTNFAILKWDSIYERGFNMINEKKASLSVIFNNDEPIDISLSYHFNKIMFSAVSSYDINYSKFGLGQVSIYKELEWCFANNYDVLDLTHGNLQYKKNWCNIVYGFEDHIIYKKKSFTGAILFLTALGKVHFRNFLKNANIDVLMEKIKIGLQKQNEDCKTDTLNYDIESVESMDKDKINVLIEINLAQENYRHLKKPFYDFLYTSQEVMEDVKIFQDNMNHLKFYFLGKNDKSKIIFINEK